MPDNLPKIETADSPTTTTTAASSTGTAAPPKPPPRAPAARKARGYRWIWVVVILALAIAGLVYYRKGQAAAQAAKAKAAAANRSVPITTATVRQGPIGVYINALGTVTSVYTATITSRVDGQIMSVDYREGQIVHQGDLLIQVDPRPYQAALLQAQGTLAHDEALLSESKIDLDRYQLAFNRNAIAKQQLDDQAQLVKQYEGSVKNDQGTLASATTNLDYASIKAPIDGRVGLRLVDPGNIVTSGGSTALVVITQLQPITVIFSVAEDYLPQIQKQLKNGNKMEVTAFDRAQQTKLATGSLLTLDNQIDTTTGTLKLKAIFQNQDLALFPNQFVNARLLVDTQQNASLAPTAAIQRNAQGTFVYVVNSNQTASLRTVTVGTTDANVAAVQGVNPGEVIAVTGFDKLQDGVKVSIANGNGNGAGGTNASGSGNSGPGSGTATGSGTQGQGSGSGPAGNSTGSQGQGSAQGSGTSGGGGGSRQ
ncbi:MAG: MdtA/MuxA family multidrug efflux RND transporter periplasmic adaptor subunit [Candidatus Acidiferrales bacterium]